MHNVIETHDVTKVYEGEVPVHALRGITLRIAANSFAAIMGPSGSGKSTLLHILGALDPPTEGRLLLEGRDASGLSDEDRTLLRRNRIGFIFQQFNLLPIFSAIENVALPLRLGGISTSEAHRRAGEMLKWVGLEDRARHLPSQLSGGEQQRVAIARALVTQPAIILADEPTGNLDSKNGQLVMSMLRRLVDDQGQTVVLVTHDAAIAAQTDRVIQMCDGLICDDQRTDFATAPAAVAPEPRT
jgi:putative ABC transport system ATP-binding protein